VGSSPTAFIFLRRSPAEGLALSPPLSGDPQPDSVLTFRPESASDHSEIHAVIAAAFRRHDEARLVRQLRENGGLAFSGVARKDGLIAGHVGYSAVSVGGQMAEPPVLALAPVAVAPAFQRQGIGLQLVHWSLNQLRDSRCPGVIVLGEPTFYRRCGFQPAAVWSICCPFDVPNDCFQAIELQHGGLASISGVVAYRPEFNSLA
jgi:putative acetyltransferase